MPFADPRYPSVGLGVLAEALRRDGHHVDVLHLHVEAAAKLGLPHYFALQGGPSWYNLTGEWLFSDPSIAPGADDEAAYREHLGPASDTLNIGMGHYRDPDGTGAHAVAMQYDALGLDGLRSRADELVRGWCTKLDFASYDVVGFTVVFQQLNASLRVADYIKKNHPEVRVVLGGAALEPPMGDAIRHRYGQIDAIFSGFADVSFPAYVRDLPEKSSQVITHAGSSIVLDDVPTPTYDEYFAALQQCRLEDKLEARVPLETSRGCWWGERKHCTFCGFNANEMRFRQKSATAAYEELRALARYGHPLYIVDNILPLDYFREVLPRAIAEGFQFPGGYCFTKSNLKRAQVELLADVGITWFQPGIESLSTNILRHIDKGVRGINNTWVLRAAEEVGVYPVWALLYGFPGESHQAYEEMAELMPSLSHLPAPTGAYRFAMTRYSPVFDGRGENGTENARPAAAYEWAFGSHPRLADQAYTFDFDLSDGSNPNRYAALAIERTERWIGLRRLPLAPRCEVFDLLGVDVLYDSRAHNEVGRGRPRIRRLSAAEMAWLERLESPVAHGVVAAEAATAQTQEVLDRLVADKLVLAQDNRYVRLAIIRRERRLSREVARVLSDKVRQLRVEGVATQQRRAAMRAELERLRDGLRRWRR